MKNEVAYFDSQASAAAALKIDISELRKAKREGCPAFRSGRVYRVELLSWLEEKRLEATEFADPDEIEEPEESRPIIKRAILAISECAAFGVLTAEQYFELCRTIVEAADDPQIRWFFWQTIQNWLKRNFSQVAIREARKAHPKILKWWAGELHKMIGSFCRVKLERRIEFSAS